MKEARDQGIKPILVEIKNKDKYRNRRVKRKILGQYLDRYNIYRYFVKIKYATPQKFGISI
jgi:hypothetical protein